MLIVDSQIHIWENGKMSAHHRQIPTYDVNDALAEMKEAGVDAAVLHPPSSLGEAVNVQAVEAVKAHPDKFCILGHFDLEAPNKEEIVRNWRSRPGMLGFRFTFNQPHQKRYWTDGSLDWFWAACEKQGYPVGLLAGGYMKEFGKIAERHPGLKIHIDHLGRHGGGAGGTDEAAWADLRRDARARQAAQCRGQDVGRARPIRARPTRTRTSTAICSRSSRRSGRSAAFGAPTSPACRAAIANA
jgi:predicted TIM-barrel fold metal-dependent hydrolase